MVSNSTLLVPRTQVNIRLGDRTEIYGPPSLPGTDQRDVNTGVMYRVANRVSSTSLIKRIDLPFVSDPHRTGNQILESVIHR